MSRNVKNKPLSCKSVETTVSTTLGHSRPSVTVEYSKPSTNRIDLALGHRRENAIKTYYGLLRPISPTVH